MHVIRQNGPGICSRRCRKGVRASFIQYLDVIQSLERKGIQVKVSDISDAMELPRPGVTRTVKEMEEKGYLKKMASEEMDVSHTLLLQKRLRIFRRNMTNNILTACFLIWKKSGRRCRMYDTDDREILSDHVRKEETLR